MTGGQLPKLLLPVLLTWAARAVSGAKQNNIIFVVADAAGYSDFESHDPSMSTAHIRALREDGVYLNQSYVLPICAPSRAAFMTGRYPHTFGLQDNSLNANMLYWISENFTFLPRELQRLNYTTHMLGKWHLGSCHPGFTPLGRGFDTFYGFLLGSHDSYYTHTKGVFYDWWDNDQVDFSARGVYQTELLNARAVKIVEDYNQSQPFFMYLAYGAPHGPFEVPEHYMDTFCADITNRSRRIHCGMMAALDMGVGAVVAALKTKGIYEQTVIVFLSDKGGPIKNGSVNFPLRSGKRNLYEGGIRSYTIFRGPGFEPNTTWSGLAHAIDWFPTFISAAGGARPNFTHGYDLYDSIRESRESPREDFIIINDVRKYNHTLLRWKQWKLLTSIPGLSPSSRWIPGASSGWYPSYQELEQGVPWENVRQKYKPGQYLLYNVEQDPQERTDVYDTYKNESFVQTMKDRIREYLGVPGVSNGTFPLYPFPYPPTVSSNSRDGVLPTCWCHPAGLPDCRKGVTTADPDTSGGGSVCGCVGLVLILWAVSVFLLSSEQ